MDLHMDIQDPSARKWMTTQRWAPLGRGKFSCMSTVRRLITLREEFRPLMNR